jgi:Zn-dependent protease with chaperone function
VEDPDFQAALASLPRDLRPKGCADRRLRRPVVAALIAGTLAVLLFLWFVAIPVGGDAVGNALPDEYGKAITTTLVDGMLARYPQDHHATGQLADFAEAVGLPRAEDIEFYVVNSSQTNAFAVMGGRIFVHKPILGIPQSSEEFAALLFHEYAHLKLKHTGRATMRSLASFMLVSVLLGDTSGAAAVLLQNLDTLQNLNYSREFESEADAMAVRMLAERGMDPEAFSRLIERLSEEREGLPGLPELFNTHPDDQVRIKAGKALATSLTGTLPSVKVDTAKAAGLWEALDWD